MKYLAPNGQVVAGIHNGLYVYVQDGVLCLYEALIETGLLATVALPKVKLNPAAITSYRDLGKNMSTNMTAVANATWWLGIGAGLLASQIAKNEIYSVLIEHFDKTTSTLELDSTTYRLLVSAIISSNANSPSADQRKSSVNDANCGIMMPPPPFMQSEASVQISSAIEPLLCADYSSETTRIIAIENALCELKGKSGIEFSAAFHDKVAGLLDFAKVSDQIKSERRKLIDKYALLINQVENERAEKLKETVDPIEAQIKELSEKLSKLGLFAKKEKLSLGAQIDVLKQAKEKTFRELNSQMDAEVSRLDRERDNEISAVREALEQTLPSNDITNETNEAYYLLAEELMARDVVRGAALAYKKAGNYKDSAAKYRVAFRKVQSFCSPNQVIAAGQASSLALLANGTIAATDFVGPEFEYNKILKTTERIYFNENQINAQNVVAVSASYRANGPGHSPFTLVLQKDGRVKAFGSNKYGQCNVDSWNNIVAITAGSGHSVGLKDDGTVVATGYNTPGTCNVQSWTDVVAISACASYTAGITLDGKILVTDPVPGAFFGGGFELMRHSISLLNEQPGLYGFKRIAASKHGLLLIDRQNTVHYLRDGVWTWCSEFEAALSASPFEAIDVVSGCRHFLVLRADGTVLALGNETKDGQCAVSEWRDIVAISAGFSHSLGLTKAGRVVSTTGMQPDNNFGQSAVEQLNPSNPLPPSSTAAPAPDGIEMIKKYKELLDMGIITQEEFDTKKKELLNL